MIERLLAVVFAALAGAAAADERTVSVGYVALAEDPRYVEGSEHAGIEFRTLGRPLAGAEMGIEDADAVGRAMGLDFRLLVETGESVASLAEAARGWAGDGVAIILADLPPEALLGFADALAEAPALILNVSAREDRLRGADCRGNVAHLIPSRAMLADALVQHLVDKGWTRILALKGERPEDAETVAALERAARRFGAEIVATRDFALTADPRRRDASNVALMTAGVDADVVFVADASGEFGRHVPYRTARPTPVVGAAGLTPAAWHWAWDRYGAPQVQHRLEALAPPRRMNAETWAAWVAVKAAMQAALRAPGGFEEARDHLLGEGFRLDGSKGAAMSFRPWNRQLRQPILLATADAVVAQAPLEPFLHRSNHLDTLGVDEPESECPIPSP